MNQSKPTCLRENQIKPPPPPYKNAKRQNPDLTSFFALKDSHHQPPTNEWYSTTYSKSPTRAVEEPLSPPPPKKISLSYAVEHFPRSRLHHLFSLHPPTYAETTRTYCNGKVRSRRK